MQNYMSQYRPMVYRALPVSSEAEINGITVDFNGMPTYLHNQTTNEIYIKQFDIKTGVTSIQKFIKADKPESDLSEGKSQKDINTYKEELNAINGRLDGLKNMIENLSVSKTETVEIKGGKNAK